jgi:hypothetical protein
MRKKGLPYVLVCLVQVLCINEVITTRSFVHNWGHPSAISFLWIHTILHDILGFDTIITRYQRYFMTLDQCKICQKNSAKCVICMSNTHNGTRWMHQMHKSGIKYANSCKRYVLKNAKSQVILILEANWRQFTLHTSLLISCDIFKKNAISIF